MPYMMGYLKPMRSTEQDIETMAVEVRQEAAKVYKFPTQGRRSLNSAAVQPMTVDEFAAQRVASVDFGSGWYHEAAIAEDRRN